VNLFLSYLHPVASGVSTSTLVNASMKKQNWIPVYKGGHDSIDIFYRIKNSVVDQSVQKQEEKTHALFFYVSFI
jgi:hypothetical protein